MKEFEAWVIDTKSDEGHGYLGRYYFGYKIPEHMEGCRIAMFETRRSAREYLYQMRVGYNPYPKAQVKHVLVSLKEIE